MSCRSSKSCTYQTSLRLETSNEPTTTQESQVESQAEVSLAKPEKSQNLPLPPALEAAAEQNFASFYLRQTTQEFADDLDKLRTASDFNDRSVELLVDSLQKGTACFSKQDRIRVGRAGMET
jgi:hypothetical protein